VHPDKNSHPGASEAMKRLNNAFQRLEKGEPRTRPVVAVAIPQQRKEAEKPPKVISVKTHK
jgi:hypothetical protein